MANETITGKIFQLKDPSNSYNRFPRTVMEAVYGLNTYLQNQFSALADIYMPIEGITESKPLQEFVYRACPSSIKAKSLTLDRIYGKTLAWNQLVADSYKEEKEITFGEIDYADLGVRIPRGHKVFVQGWIKSSNPAYFSLYGDHNTSTTGSGQYELLSDLIVRNDMVTGLFIHSATNTSIKIKEVVCVDLTLMFGAGNEPSTVEEFEVLFPGYHSYEEGKLISNDASVIETVGFNQWDEEWESGYFGYDASNAGQPRPNASTIRTKNFIKVIAGRKYYFLYPEAITHFYWLYDANFNCIVNASPISGSTVILIPANAAFMKFACEPSYGTTYNHDICINLSDPAKNGTYEPYRKSVMQLGLNNLKVKSHNIWDEEWEVGTIDSNGAFVASNLSIRGKNYYPVQGGKTYRFTGGNAVIYCYDANKTFIPYTGQTGSAVWMGGIDVNNNIFVLPFETFYIRFCMSEAYGTTYNNNICINVSSSFNGQYEPHGDITITGGLKSAGDVCDEIVGNKYIKRVGSVDLGSLNWTYFSEYNAFNSSNISTLKQFTNNLICARYSKINNAGIGGGSDKAIATNYDNYNVNIWDSAYSDASTFKTAMSGVMLYYELATPIEYELVSPIVPTVKAGTTEARISPNADSLSAPMVADMTYSAGQSEDATQAQYATVAGRLYNSHKLWGQDFDGTQDVTGALTGVTSITMNGALSGVTTLSASGAATLGSTLSVGGLATIAGGIKVTTTKKIWFGDTYYIELDSNGYLHTNAGFYSDSFITAGGTNSNA